MNSYIENLKEQFKIKVEAKIGDCLICLETQWPVIELECKHQFCKLKCLGPYIKNCVDEANVDMNCPSCEIKIPHALVQDICWNHDSKTFDKLLWFSLHKVTETNEFFKCPNPKCIENIIPLYPWETIVNCNHCK